MTQLQGAVVVLPDNQAIAQLELEQYIEEQADAIAPFAITYSFDYNQFKKPELQSKARTTLGNFLGFVRQTFDGLLESGRALQHVYDNCIAMATDGKKIFAAWLDSPDFGASRYIAKASMEIYTWFEKLPKRVQHLVREKVQNWSVAALRQLTQISTDLVKDLVGTGKKTVAQIKAAATSKLPTPKANTLYNSKSVLVVRKSDSIASSKPQFAPGVRVIVVEDNMGCTGCRGIIISKWDKTDSDLWWVLLDHTVSMGLETKRLFEPEQLQVEVSTAEITPKQTKLYTTEKLYTAAQLEQKIAEALAQQNKEKAEEELGRFVEIRDAALKAATVELQAARAYAQKMAQAKEEVAKKLIETERELGKVRSLQTEKTQLEQRVAQLEKALEDANKNRWSNTFNSQAAKVVNSELEKTITPLMSQVEHLNNVLLLREEELAELQVVNTKQQEEITQLRQLLPLPNIETQESTIIAEFGHIGEQFGWAGWSRQGYRAVNGILHTGINAIAAFVFDLTNSQRH